MSNPAGGSRANVKPLTHWIIRQGYTVRFTERQTEQVAGVLSTPDGPVDFTYDTARQIVHLPDRSVSINAYGWESEPTRNRFGSVTFDPPPSDSPSNRKPPFGRPRTDADN